MPPGGGRSAKREIPFVVHFLHSPLVLLSWVHGAAYTHLTCLSVGRGMSSKT
uniref:Uncharacterized protein n=1 Tax=Anguilla anguilla TaxID=7936 RepID=A0A0E9WIS8_ANGAN